MKKTVIVAILGVCFLPILANAAPNWGIYSDAVIVDGDEYNSVGVFDTPPDHTTLDMSGGLVDSLTGFDQSTVNITGGIVYTLNSMESSTINISGGRVNHATGLGTSTLVVDSPQATVWDIVALGTSTAYVSHGDIGKLGAGESGIVHVTGGSAFDYFVADGSGSIHVYGTSLAKTSSGGQYDRGFVSGFWSNGSSFSIPFSITDTYSRVTLHEIPEPSVMLLIAFGAISLRRRFS